MTLKFNRILEVVELNMFVQSFIKLSAVVHELLCSQRKIPSWKQCCRRSRVQYE